MPSMQPLHAGLLRKAGFNRTPPLRLPPVRLWATRRARALMPHLMPSPDQARLPPSVSTADP